MRIIDFLGFKVKAHRLQRFYRDFVLDMTQTEFARLNGIPQSSIAHHETGARWCNAVNGAYYDMGFGRWLDEFLGEWAPAAKRTLEGTMCQYLHDQYPDKVPVRRNTNV